jgi:hypothetical protein
MTTRHDPPEPSPLAFGAYAVRCPACYAERGEWCRDLRANGPSSGSRALKHPHEARQLARCGPPPADMAAADRAAADSLDALFADAGPAVRRQAGHAEALADELVRCGHDVGALDLLDALASCGLVLLFSSGSEAASAYAAIMRQVHQ